MDNVKVRRMAEVRDKVKFRDKVKTKDKTKGHGQVMVNVTVEGYGQCHRRLKTEKRFNKNQMDDFTGSFHVPHHASQYRRAHKSLSFK